MAMGLAAPTWAQSQQQPDQVDRLAQMVGLSDEQQSEIRGILEELQGEIQSLQMEARSLQQQLQDEIKPDYDEASIREQASKLGELSGEISALSTLMQARVDSVFTQEQRDELDRRMRAMQQQMQGQPPQPGAPAQ
ncbi:Spy/CpxP family protein refolding chaperone [Marinobacter xestospongiae]|uniref:Spy/CpxP family protein refolding chaperone n=1 Tax=Marinobacter xestospongiae TaxID=994319 RepID=A0ABU3VT45_9GAMM|nr:Spy/CpxP family protein refolding chaperone [Marinobacter xestospongiae]MCG8519013.1 Spy/CpxP family protein refolding chaperone [Pseudomonadales bacterium]MDV2077441.1 Spy/CpxP family protein refolding chaperone [Marinobacter xestospongiae]